LSNPGSVYGFMPEDSIASPRESHEIDDIKEEWLALSPAE